LFRGGAEIEVTPVLPAVPTSLIDALSGAANPNPAALIPPPPSVLPPPPAPPSPGIGNEADSPGLVQEARRSIEAGRFQAAEEAYASYLRANPGDAAIAAERAELHFRHIDPEGGVLLMLQALRMEGLTVPDRTRLRLPIAQRRMETGDYGSAKEILLDAAREDPTDQDVRLFLDEVARFESGPPPPGGPVHPLVAEARSLAAQGRNAEADRAYEEYLKQNPQDGPVLAERAEFVYFNIQQARGMQLMVQAARLPGLPIHERTRLRLIVAQRRLEHGNLITARQMLIEASRDDPGNPAIGKLLFQIEEIERRIREEAAHRGPPPPGVHPDPRAELLRGLIEAIAEEIEED
jgi:tetratricopeptide (TPR) repeat protein